MSFDLDWNKLDDELAGYVIQFLNRNFQAISKPSFIGNINVIAFDWGTTAPTVEIIDITDPFPEFYEPNDTEDDLENNNNDNNNNTSDTLNNNNNNNNSNNNNNNNNNIDTNNSNNKINTLSASPTVTSHSNDPYFNTVESNHPYRPERFSYPLSPQPLFHQQQQQLLQQQQQQQRIQLMHSFHRSPLVAPQHPFNHMVPTTPHGTNSYFPSRTTSPTTSSSFIEYRQQQQQQQQQQQNDNSTGIDINDWIDDELNHSSTANKHFHPNSSSSSSPPPPPPPPPPQSASQPPSIRDESTRMDFQAHLLVSYKGDMSMTILTELRMNYPSMEFMSLPIQLCVRSVEFEATAVVAYIQSMNRVCVSMLEAEEEDISTIRDKEMIGLGSLLRHVHIESIVGDEQKHVLKNVGKIERFIVDQLRRMLDDELVFPSYQCVELG
ncbi:unnamed protein product [Cunninghamella echinulata]